MKWRLFDMFRKPAAPLPATPPTQPRLEDVSDGLNQAALELTAFVAILKRRYGDNQ